MIRVVKYTSDMLKRERKVGEEALDLFPPSAPEDSISSRFYPWESASVYPSSPQSVIVHGLSMSGGCACMY
jgi:hypothetical protein